MATIKSFGEQDCYKACSKFRNQVANFCETLLAKEDFPMKSQPLRAARSVTVNIAEGFGRDHHQENLQFCHLARGSITECLDHLNAALDENFLTKERYNALHSQHEMAGKLLNGYISHLSRTATTSK